MRTKVLGLLFFVPLAACVNSAVGSTHSNNPDIDVETLFVHDGCTVYRFRDASYHYFVRCQAAPTVATLSQVSCGKNCVRAEEIPTVASVAPAPAMSLKP